MRCTSTQARSTASTTIRRRASMGRPPSLPGPYHCALQEVSRVKGGSLVAPQSQADILKCAVIVIVAGQANVGFLCNADIAVD